MDIRCMVVSKVMLSQIHRCSNIVTYPERKEWKYGKALQLSWGDQPVRPCEEKWIFVFNVDQQ
jgi:hypothetical protein